MQRAECLPQNTGTYQPASPLKEPSLQNTALLVKRRQEEERETEGEGLLRLKEKMASK